VHTRLWGSTKLIGGLRRRGAAIPLGLLAVGALIISIISGVAASAAPQPTVAQVKARVSQLNSRLDQLVQQYDQVRQELASASQRLTRLDSKTRRYLHQFNAMRAQVAQIAMTAYETGNLTSPGVLLTSGNAQQILDRASILQELSSSSNAAMSRFLAAAHQLSGAQQAAHRTKDARAALKAKLTSEKDTLEQTLAQQRALLARLTPAQRVGTGPGRPTSPTSSTSPAGSHNPPPPPVSGAAAAAVQFAYNQLGCPYVWAGTGPCQQGFDCSGLTQAAWAAAGVSIPRTSFEQMAGLPAVSTSELQPGDLLGFNGNEHIGIYVGGGMLIDAPIPGQVVEKVALSGWYAANLDGAVRP
jgi:cell wall-associated NlpC family hydrolase